MLEFYGFNNHVLTAAAEASPPMKSSGNSSNQHAAWLQALPASTKDAWLADLMADSESSVRREILAEFRKSASIASWPVAPGTRTMSQLNDRIGEIMEDANRKAMEKEERDRAHHLAKLKSDPRQALEKSEKLVQSKSYKQIAELLSDVREALEGTSQAELAETQAKKLNQKHPTLRILTSELRKKGFLKKN